MQSRMLSKPANKLTKNNQGRDVMLGAPGLVDQKQLDELMIDLREIKE